MMKYTKRILAIFLAALLLLAALPVTALAAQESTPKEEVVYINLNADGSVKEIHVVNIFELTEDGTILDYGKYESLRNMTSTDEISYRNSTVTIDAKAGKLYYEGKLQSNVMPWDISIRYYMNGVEYSADQIAGKSGSLKITISITENTDCVGTFFEGYALQASVTLDTDNCTNIVAQGATIANVGSDKQLTYTILPNTGAEIEITADVTDFEMEAIAINGIKLDLSISIDQAMIQEKLDTIVGAVEKLDEGAGALYDGASQLYDGTTLLEEKMAELLEGTGTLTDGLEEISDNNFGLEVLAYASFKSFCKTAEMTLESYGYADLGLTPKNYTQVLMGLLEQLSPETYASAYSKALADTTAQADALADNLYINYVADNADSFYQGYLQTQADTLYAQVGAQIVLEELMEQGYTEEAGLAYLQTEAGQALVRATVTAMSEDQKQQILDAALEELTYEQKAQIRSGVVAALTDEQKAQIREEYIQQIMDSVDVSDEIAAAVAKLSDTGEVIAKLKGYLDDYNSFFNNLRTYTSAVATAAAGAKTLYEGVGQLHVAVGTLNEGVKTLYDGTTTLKDGTGQFAEALDGLGGKINDMIDSMVDTALGKDLEVTSFVSEDNTNVEMVQFVIKTAPISADQTAEEVPVVAEKLTFWQKLLRLFGLY